METDTTLMQAGAHLAMAQRHLAPLTLEGNPAVRACWDELNQVAVLLTRSGGAVQPQASEALGLRDLERLRRLDSSRPEAEALAIALEALLPLAEALDKARGDWAGDMASVEGGETPGTNYAESIQELHLRLRQEVHGAKGGGLE